MKFLIFILFPFILTAQTKILFTSVDYRNDDVRAAIYNFTENNRIELGFNRTFLPVWFGNNILFNSNNLIWKCNSEGENLEKVSEGFRISVSHNEEMFAFYNKDGIGVSDKNGKIFKQIYVDAWNEVTLTWSNGDSLISFFRLDDMKCFLFNIKNESFVFFGDSVFHPVWNKKNNMILYNKMRPDNTFLIYIKDELNTFNEDRLISKVGEMSIIPVWSNSGTKIAYITIANDDDQYSLEFTDMLKGSIKIYDLNTRRTEVITENAAYTDQAYPQFLFDENDEFIYFTTINEYGNGSLARINIKSLQTEIISKDKNIDERFPLVKTF